METKTLAFDVRDIEQFKEFFPDFKSGKMSGRELGSRLLELLHNQATSPATSSIQVNEDDFKQLQHDFQDLQDHCNHLEAQLAAQLAETPATPENTDLQHLQQDLQQELQDAINEKDELQAQLQNLQAENQQLAELQATTASTLEARLQELQAQNAALEARCKDLKMQLKEAASHQDAYAFTPYFKQLVAVVADKINALSGTCYSQTDVIMQTVFATYFNSHTSIRYTYPVSKAELLALAQQFYPEVTNEEDLFRLMIYRVKEEL